jgi:hypothetical protein
LKYCPLEKRCSVKRIVFTAGNGEKIGEYSRSTLVVARLKVAAFIIDLKSGDS